METIKEYIAQYEGDKKKALEEVYGLIRGIVPAETTERMSWQMPTFYLNGNLVHFAMNKNHLGFYPGENGIRQFEGEFKEAGYKYSKGAVQFPLSKPLPIEMIEKIVRFRVSENIK